MIVVTGCAFAQTFADSARSPPVEAMSSCAFATPKGEPDEPHDEKYGSCDPQEM
jgi:hypothetical protein